MSGPPALDDIPAVLAEAPRVAAAWVFGSVARGDARPDSDLDLAVLLDGAEREGDAQALFALSAELERFSPSGRVDVLVLGPQGSVLRHRVLAEGRLVKDADPQARMEFEERTTREYLDWKPTHDIAMHSTFAGLRDRFAAKVAR
jgi:predicted nucleotidyltransferase